MLNYGQHPRVPMSAPIRFKNVMAQDFMENLHKLQQQAKLSMERAQQRAKLWADKRRSELTFEVGDMVLLNTKNLTLKHPGSKKFLPKWIGPYKVIKAAGPVAYKLDLPAHMKVHNVFHVSLLKPYHSSGTVQPPQPVQIEFGEVGYVPEVVLAHRGEHQSANGEISRSSKEYLVKWLGNGVENNTWEPLEVMQQYPVVLSAYEQKVEHMHELHYAEPASVATLYSIVRMYKGVH
jgi:hypothetical protein